MQNTKRTKIDLIGYYLARGEIEKAVEVADNICPTIESLKIALSNKRWWTETFMGN